MMFREEDFDSVPPNVVEISVLVDICILYFEELGSNFGMLYFVTNWLNWMATWTESTDMAILCEKKLRHVKCLCIIYFIFTVFDFALIMSLFCNSPT